MKDHLPMKITVGWLVDHLGDLVLEPASATHIFLMKRGIAGVGAGS
jgi:hypothetical protein